MAQSLLDPAITSAGSLQSNQKEIPAKINGIKKQTHEIHWKMDNGILNLQSQVVKTISSENKRF